MPHSELMYEVHVYNHHGMHIPALSSVLRKQTFCHHWTKYPAYHPALVEFTEPHAPSITAPPESYFFTIMKLQQ